jgi:hypothetical protein
MHNFVRFEVFTAVTMKNAIFWDVAAATCSHWFLACGFFYPEDRGDRFLRNVGSHKIYTEPHLRRQHSCIVLFASTEINITVHLLHRNELFH